jgi:hypothetical protein
MRPGYVLSVFSPDTYIEVTPGLSLAKVQATEIVRTYVTAYTPPRSSLLRRRRGRKSMRRSPRAYLQLRREQRRRCGSSRHSRRRPRATIPVSPGRITFTHCHLPAHSGIAEMDGKELVTLLEPKHYNLGIRSQPQRRSPGSCSTRSENLHLPDPA